MIFVKPFAGIGHLPATVTKRQIVERSHSMKKYSLVLALGLIALIIPAAAAQDLHKTYTLGSGGSIKLHNISGNIKITGISGNNIIVDAIVTGRDRQLINIEEVSTPSGLELRARYPERAGNIEASVSFDVRVPASFDYNFDSINSVSGSLEVTGVRGRLHLNTVSGQILATGITGMVDANTVSGDLEVDIPRIEGTGDMKFNSVSGDVIVAAPANIGAHIELSTLSGALDTNFPIQIEEKKYGPGRSARGDVGARKDLNLKLNTVSGKVSLTAK
jgi:DUF4097 and DUF4098 domain-containing protein YvlB